MEEPSVGRWVSLNTLASTATKNISWMRQKREKYVVLPTFKPNHTDNDASSSLTPIFRIRKTYMGVTRPWSPNEPHATRSSGSILTGLQLKS